MTLTNTAAPAPARTASSVLLTRRALIALPDEGATSAASRTVAAGVVMLETDLVERGYLLSADLRTALSALDASSLALVGSLVLADVDQALGANRTHVPLFRSFPDNVPADTLAFWVDRVLTVYLQVEGAPCVLCGDVDQVHPVDPCAHLVCRSCFDGSMFAACPICHRHINADDPFLRPAARRRPLRRTFAGPDRLRVLGLARDLESLVVDELTTLLSSTTALSPADLDDLVTLLGTRTRSDLTFVPATINARESKAHVLAWLLEDPASYDATVPVATALVDTATDVLRLLAVRSAADAGLVDVPRFTECAASAATRRAEHGELHGPGPARGRSAASPRPVGSSFAASAPAGERKHVRGCRDRVRGVAGNDPDAGQPGARGQGARCQGSVGVGF